MTEFSVFGQTVPLILILHVCSTGQTGRYVLIMKLHGTERHLVADDCPLQLLVQLGQLAAEVQFILQRTGPSLSNGPNTPTREMHLPRPGSSEPQPLEHRKPNKAFPFSSSTHPRRNKTNRAWSPSPRASPEPRASPVSFLDPHHTVKAIPSSSSSKEEVFRQVLQQQRRLQDLEVQLQSLEREAEVWEQERSSAAAPSPTSGELEEQLRQKEAEQMLIGHWEEQLQAEMDRERGTCSNLFTFSTFLASSSDISKCRNVNTIISYYQQICTDDYSRCTLPWMITAIRSWSSKPDLHI